MSFSAFHEQKLRGSFDFPVEFHYVEQGHPKYEMPFHWHSEYEFVLVLDGCLHLSLDGVEMRLEKGDAALISGGVVHGGSPERCTYECIVLDMLGLFDTNRVCRSLLDHILCDDVILMSRHEKGSAVNGILDRMFDAMEREYTGYELTVKGLILQLLGEISKGHLYYRRENAKALHSKRDRQLKNSLEFIHTNFNRSITLQELAAKADMSPKYFCRFFKEMTNRTPIEYLVFYRIERACEQLSTNEKSITEVALDCGFNDLSYFIKTFKKLKGLSPKKYQKTLR